MDVKALRIRSQIPGELDQLVARNARRLFVFGFVAAAKVAVPVFWKIAHHRLLGDLGRAFLCGLILALDGAYPFREILDGELFRVNLVQRRMLLDRLVHQRLGYRGIVYLAMSMTPIPDQIDDYVGAEFVAVLGCDARDAQHRVHIFTIHMKDRNGLSPGQLR